MHYSVRNIINGKYTVINPIKQGAYAETYRVKAPDGQRCFLKLIDRELLQPHQLTPEGTIAELDILAELDHPNLTRFIEQDTLELGGKAFTYVVGDFLPSETLADRLQRERRLSVAEAKQVTLGLLDAVACLHNRPRPIIHNEITALNTLIALYGHDLRTATRLIDFGYARHLGQAHNQSIDGLDWFYLANERFLGEGSQQSDLFSVGAVLHQMLFGQLPWAFDLGTIPPAQRQAHLIDLRYTPLPQPRGDFEPDDRLMAVLEKALAPHPTDRFQTAEEFAEALQDTALPPASAPRTEPLVWETEEETSVCGAMEEDTGFCIGGCGFDEVAGMDDLKDLLERKVIYPLKNPEKAKAYRLQPANGILFYGPPGCGKTFLAEKFAEQTGYHFSLVKGSDIGSTYIHGTQMKIGALFAEAEKHRPAILCFDEFDTMAPSRDQCGQQTLADQVGEFLSQLNNCGRRGICVIASTNRPDAIDKAALRKGRMDKIVYVPLPDARCRAAMFQMHLQGRPYDSNMDCDRLAELTNQYVAADIAYVVNEAAEQAAFSDVKISQSLIEEVIAKNKPSLSPQDISYYDALHRKMEGLVPRSHRIGF